MTLQLATVFSGIGAVEFALKRMAIPHHIVFAADIDKFVKEAYFENYEIDEDRWYDDIHDIYGSKYQDRVDLLVGGPPCQSFSSVGDEDGLDDERGLLIFDYINLIKEVQPKIFIFENVRGLLTKEKIWQKLLNRFNSTGYRLKYQTMNSKDYGIPQNRERLFLVGVRDHNRSIKFPEPTGTKITMHDLLEDTDRDITTRTDLSELFGLPAPFYVDPPTEVIDKYTLSDKVRSYVKSSGTKNFYSKPEWDLEIARPLLATMHKMHRAGVDNYISLDNREEDDDLRRLTPREALRLMGFDDRFVQNEVSDTQTYRQAGNSIVVDVLIHLLISLNIKQFMDTPQIIEVEN